MGTGPEWASPDQKGMGRAFLAKHTAYAKLPMKEGVFYAYMFSSHRFQLVLLHQGLLQSTKWLLWLLCLHAGHPQAAGVPACQAPMTSLTCKVLEHREPGLRSLKSGRLMTILTLMIEQK